MIQVKYSDKWHIGGEKMHEMEELRQTALKSMSREEFKQKETETFRAVRDFLKESKNALAYNRCIKKPWIFYGVYSFEECVKILLAESTKSRGKDGESDG